VDVFRENINPKTCFCEELTHTGGLHCHFHVDTSWRRANAVAPNDYCNFVE
jgi:hypothetical protein